MTNRTARRPFFWGRERTVAYIGEEIGNLLDPQATKASPHYDFIQELEKRGDQEFGGVYSEELKQEGPSWAALMDSDYPLTQGQSPEDPTGWGKSRSAQQAPAEVEHTYAVYGKNPSANQKKAREGHLKSGKKMPMANRRMVGLLKTIRNVAFAHRSQHVQFGRFDSEEDVMRYMIDPFPWLLMAVYELDHKHKIAGSVATTAASDKGAATGGEATTDDEAKAGYSTDGAAKPKGKKPATSSDEAGKGKKKVKSPKASAVIKNSKDAKTIQQLKETVNRVKHDVSVKDYEISANHSEISALKSTLDSLASLAKGKDFSALEEELAAFRAQTSLGSAPEAKSKPVTEPEPQGEPAHHPKKAGEAEPEPEPEPTSKPEPAPEPE
jgi:hypothetical protein